MVDICTGERVGPRVTRAKAAELGAIFAECRQREPRVAGAWTIYSRDEDGYWCGRGWAYEVARATRYASSVSAKRTIRKLRGQKYRGVASARPLCTAQGRLF